MQATTKPIERILTIIKVNAMTTVAKPLAAVAQRVISSGDCSLKAFKE